MGRCTESEGEERRSPKGGSKKKNENQGKMCTTSFAEQNKWFREGGDFAGGAIRWAREKGTKD